MGERKAQFGNTVAKLDKCFGYCQRAILVSGCEKFFRRNESGRFSMDSDKLKQCVESLEFYGKNSTALNKANLLSFLNGNQDKSICSFAPQDVNRIICKIQNVVPLTLHT